MDVQFSRVGCEDAFRNTANYAWGWSIAVCPSPYHEVDAESAHRVDAQWLQVDRGATIGNDHQHFESDDHYPSSRIFLALRSGGTHCLVEVAMLLRPPQVQLA